MRGDRSRARPVRKAAPPRQAAARPRKGTSPSPSLPRQADGGGGSKGVGFGMDGPRSPHRPFARCGGLSSARAPRPARRRHPRRAREGGEHMQRVHRARLRRAG